MTADVTALLPAFTLAARKLLVEEISEQLEGIYGFLPDGTLSPAEQYPALAAVPDAAETRRRLEGLLADEREAQISAAEARARLIKETAFTWLNRLVAFKMLEARKLLKQTISRGAESNGFKLWLTEAGQEHHRRDYELGDLPQNALGEGPRQRAYRRFLLAQCARLAEEAGLARARFGRARRRNCRRDYRQQPVRHRHRPAGGAALGAGPLCQSQNAQSQRADHRQRSGLRRDPHAGRRPVG